MCLKWHLFRRLLVGPRSPIPGELLDAAERLIAEHGFEVPLREIAVAAGQRNNSAVNYCFRTRQDLIDAVVARRLVPMEAERQAMLDGMSPAEMADPAALIRVLVQPFLHSEGTLTPVSSRSSGSG